MPMCCVPYCRSQGGHKFPKENLKQREAWITALNHAQTATGEAWQPTRYSVVCKLHFSPESIYKGTINQKVFLKPGAVPSRFLPPPLDTQKTLHKKKEPKVQNSHINKKKSKPCTKRLEQQQTGVRKSPESTEDRVALHPADTGPFPVSTEERVPPYDAAEMRPFPVLESTKDRVPPHAAEMGPFPVQLYKNTIFLFHAGTQHADSVEGAHLDSIKASCPDQPTVKTGWTDVSSIIQSADKNRLAGKPGLSSSNIDGNIACSQIPRVISESVRTVSWNHGDNDDCKGSFDQQVVVIKPELYDTHSHPTLQDNGTASSTIVSRNLAASLSSAEATSGNIEPASNDIVAAAVSNNFEPTSSLVYMLDMIDETDYLRCSNSQGLNDLQTSSQQQFQSMKHEKIECMSIASHSNGIKLEDNVDKTKDYLCFSNHHGLNDLQTSSQQQFQSMKHEKSECISISSHPNGIKLENNVDKTRDYLCFSNHLGLNDLQASSQQQRHSMKHEKSERISVSSHPNGIKVEDKTSNRMSMNCTAAIRVKIEPQEIIETINETEDNDRKNDPGTCTGVPNEHKQCISSSSHPNRIQIENMDKTSNFTSMNCIGTLSVKIKPQESIETINETDDNDRRNDPSSCTGVPHSHQQPSQTAVENTQTNLEHNQLSVKEQLYECQLCRKAFTCRRNLQVHLWTHTDEKPYKCKDCDKSFKTSKYLQKHGIVHTGEKRYSCDVCAKKFPRLNALKRHQEIHTRPGRRMYLLGKGTKRHKNANKPAIRVQYL